MSLEKAAAVFSIAVALLAFAGVVYNAGRYGEKLGRFERNLSDIRLELSGLITRFVPREVMEIDAKHITEKLEDIKGTLHAHNSALNTIMIQLGRLSRAADGYENNERHDT